MDARALLTAEDLLALPDDGMRHELVEGELTTMTPAGYEHGKVAFRVAGLLGQYLASHPTGEAFGAETGFGTASHPDTVRAPAAAFVSREGVAEVSTERGFGRGAPDPAAEVVSPDDSYADVDLKVRQWLRAGTRQVWVANPRARTGAVHAPGADVRILRGGDTLEGGAVLPGFRCAVAEVFG